MYKAVCTIKENGIVLDRTETMIGIRTIRFDPENGFFINEGSIKLKGGTMHSNNGPLGAAAYDRDEERRIELMKNAGFNAVRCAHNPPSAPFLDACDRLGMMVIDEAFDCWIIGNRPDDYHIHFNNWWQRDVSSMIMRDRNHPSVICWSIGNQIRESRDSSGIALAYQVADYVRSFDSSRPVTANISMSINGQFVNGSSDLWQEYDPIFSALDICGYSYQSIQYVTDHKRLPDRIMFSSGINPRDCFRNWSRATENKFVLGNFTWTAMDYIGESGDFPLHNSICSDFDICGFRKPRSYYREILFNHEDHLYLFVHDTIPSVEGIENSRWGWDNVKPSWTWPDYDNKILKVEAYSACDSVELFLNGKSLGIKPSSRENEFKALWKVPYLKGTLSALGYKDNEKVSITKLVTAGDPYKIRLTPDRHISRADNMDLSFVKVEILDDRDNLVPYADNLINFKVKGEGSIAAVGNSDPVSLESFQQPSRKAYGGKCLLIVKSNERSGQIIIKAESDGLLAGKIIIDTNRSTNMN